MMKPVWKRVVIKDSSIEESKTESGLIVPNTEIPDAIAEVVAVGEAVEYVRPGDKILYNKNMAIAFRHQAADYRIIHEEGVYVILDRKEK